MAGSSSRSCDMDGFRYKSKSSYERKFREIIRAKSEIESMVCFDGEADAACDELDAEYEELMEEYLRFCSENE